MFGRVVVAVVVSVTPVGVAVVVWWGRAWARGVGPILGVGQ